MERVGDMILRPVYTSRFKKDLKKIEKDKESIAKLKQTVDILLSKQTLPESYYPHPLSGNYKDCMECHIKPDLLLIYQINQEVLILRLLRLGSHSALFK